MSVAYIYAMRGDFSQALEQYKSLIEKNPDSADLQKNFIAVLLSCSRAEMAEEFFEQFKVKFPDDKDISDIKNKISTALADKAKEKVSADEKKIE